MPMSIDIGWVELVRWVEFVVAVMFAISFVCIYITDPDQISTVPRW